MQRDEAADSLAAVFAEMMRGGREAAFCVETEEGKAEVSLSLLGAGGQMERFPICTPAEMLLRTVEIDYAWLRDEVMRLWEQYPLDGYDRAAKKEELTRLSEEVRETSALLREIDSLGDFYVTQQLERNRPALDEALASENANLMEAGARLLNILEEPSADTGAAAEYV